MIATFPRILLAFCVIVSTLMVSACDSADLRNNSVPSTASTEISLIARDAVESFTVTPVAGKSGATRFLLRVQFQNNRHRLRLPKGLNILSRRKDASNVVIYDDGKRFDELAGDGIYSGIISDGCVPADAEQQARAGKQLDFTCTFEFVGPGEECGEFGECPERVHRSLLWGLIEYETDIVFCVCIVECEVTKD